MNDHPPNPDEPDDIGDQYRRASAMDTSRPSERVRKAVLGHAARLAAQRGATKHTGPIDIKRTTANRAWWRTRPAIAGTLAAAVLAGLLITPLFIGPDEPRTAAFRPAANSVPRAPERRQLQNTVERPLPSPPPQAAQLRSMAKELRESGARRQVDRSRRAESGGG